MSIDHTRERDSAIEGKSTDDVWQRLAVWHTKWKKLKKWYLTKFSFSFQDHEKSLRFIAEEQKHPVLWQKKNYKNLVMKGDAYRQGQGEDDDANRCRYI